MRLIGPNLLFPVFPIAISTQLWFWYSYPDRLSIQMMRIVTVVNHDQTDTAGS